MARVGCFHLGPRRYYQHQAWWHHTSGCAPARGRSSESWPGNFPIELADIVSISNIAAAGMFRWACQLDWSAPCIFPNAVSSNWWIPSGNQKEWWPSVHGFNVQTWRNWSCRHRDWRPLFLRKGSSFGGLHRGCWPFPKGELSNVQNICMNL